MKSVANLGKYAWIPLVIGVALLVTSFSPPAQYTVSQIEPEELNDVLAGAEVLFWVEVTLYDPSLTLTYEWEANAGEIVGEGAGAQILFVAPLEPGPVELTVTVRGGSYQVSTSKTINVHPQVLPETTPDQVYTVKEGDSLSKIAQSICNRRGSDFVAIQHLANLRCQQDDRFDCIQDADFIDIGWDIYIPACDAINYYWLDQLVVLPGIDWGLPSEAISIAGSSTLFPLTNRIGELFNALGFNGHVSVESIGTGAAFERFCDGEVDMVNASRPINVEELANCQLAGRAPIPFQVGLEALALVVSADNDFIVVDEALTSQALTGLLATAETWSEVRAGWGGEDIRRYYPPETSDRLDYLAGTLFDGDPGALLAATNVVTGSEDYGALANAIAEDPNAVGFLSYAEYWNNRQALKALKVSGQSPSPATVATGAYPLVRPLYVYSSPEVMGEKPQVAAFLNVYLRTARTVMADLYFPVDEVGLRQSKIALINALGWVPETPQDTLVPAVGPTRVPAASPTPVSGKPSIGAITFAAGATEDNQPIGAATSFDADLREIHAIFSYQAMSDGDIWERIWYQDGEEVGSGSDPWDAGASGTFDLSLSNQGEPLGSGSWRLEIHVNGELARTGSFVIEGIATPTPTSQPAARNYRLAFARWDGGKHNLYIANTDGSGERFLLERAAGPSWSPDGQYLSFYGEEGVDRQVRNGVEYVVSGISNGILWVKAANFPSDITQVEIGQYVREGSGRWTAWAPNGDMLAFDAARGGAGRRIYFLGTDDNRQYSIEILGEQADWSPNSNQLVYRSGRDNKQGIWISNRDDSGARNITNEGSDSFPSWSPDGRTIAFHRDVGGNVDIYLMNVDGSNVRRLTDAAGPDTLPAWTPDGRIVFRSARGGSWGIYIMNADGSGQGRILGDADPGPDWAFGRMDVN